MHTDAHRWNARYATPGKVFSFAPDPVLCRCEALLPRGGLALEVACGTAGNSLWLARRGFRCVALDVSTSGLRLAGEEAARRELGIHLVAADALALPFDGACFDLVVVTRYLERGLFRGIRAHLKIGGCVFYRTFNQRRRITHPSFNPDYLLRDGELREVFHGLQRLAGSDDAVDTGDSSFILARRVA